MPIKTWEEYDKAMKSQEGLIPPNKGDGRFRGLLELLKFQGEKLMQMDRKPPMSAS